MRTGIKEQVRLAVAALDVAIRMVSDDEYDGEAKDSFDNGYDMAQLSCAKSIMLVAIGDVKEAPCDTQS